MNNQVFEIVQAMSGQGNCITIPGPYLDFFAGDRQQYLLAAILNQLVFWSGKSSLENSWFYKEHAALAKEIRAKDGDVVRKAMFKITEQYLAGVIEEELRQVSGTPKKHYRVDQEALIAKIFPQGGNSNNPLKNMDTAQEPNGNGLRAESKQVIESDGNGSQAECIRPKSRMETAQEPNPGNGSQAESYLYTDLKNRSLHTDHKNHAGEILPVDNFAESGREPVIPEANIPDATEDSNLATDNDFDLAMWFWSTIIEMYERAAEFDGCLAKPKEPNFVRWAQAVRQLRQEHGCSHDQIRTMIERIQRDQWWCGKVQDMPTLHRKWPELVLKLCPVNLATGGNLGFSGKVQADIPKGFRG
ncbi:MULTISPECIES: hypothetical protein [Klebsiella]|uniref:hypothetical protein n=1 Tax=Klebsiella TaxID=570 RepID=UPI000BA124AF|nr:MULTISPECIES: hypothetical protein [Klebsiella]KAB5496952.1 hypothetical protein F8562_08215 [Klebsiella sp. RCJ4]MBZ6636277.1 hypothetical protein [Klebsiella michiganensis]MBZ7140319.1 hypothetical protein [Klebsiella michiganensis]OZS25446.1 hypothetical protein CIG57_06065 [Klebsiella michiganensis]HBK4610342.1 hypothetical protein [Klebsiella michiganensis]